MSYFNNYLLRTSVEGTTTQQQDEYWLQQKVNEVFPYSPDIYTVTYKGTPVTVRLFNEKAAGGLTHIKDDFRRVLFQNIQQVVNLGDYITFGGFDWLCTDTNSINRLINYYTFRRCNTKISWIDANGVIQTYSAIAETLTNKREELKEWKFIETVFGKMLMYIPYDSNTSQIYEKQRFIVNNRAYIVSYVDNYTYVKNGVGFIALALENDQINPILDNLTLGIANYYNSQQSFSIVINNGTSASIGVNETLQLNVSVYDNGALVSNPIITYSTNNLAIATVSASGLVTGIALGNCTITVSSYNVNATISINVVSASQNNYSCTITGNNQVLINQTQQYTVSFYNNGVAYNDVASQWWLTASDGVSQTSLATLSFSGNNATLVMGAQPGGIILWVKDASGVSTSLPITINNLW